MATFNYIGKAKILWPDDTETERFIGYWADTGTLRVWDGDKEEYLGSMAEHPAKMIKFLHTADYVR